MNTVNQLKYVLLNVLTLLGQLFFPCWVFNKHKKNLWASFYYQYLVIFLCFLQESVEPTLSAKMVGTLGQTAIAFVLMGSVALRAMR